MIVLVSVLYVNILVGLNVAAAQRVCQTSPIVLSGHTLTAKMYEAQAMDCGDGGKLSLLNGKTFTA